MMMTSLMTIIIIIVIRCSVRAESTHKHWTTGMSEQTRALVQRAPHRTISDVLNLVRSDARNLTTLGVESLSADKITSSGRNGGPNFLDLQREQSRHVLDFLQTDLLGVHFLFLRF